MDGSRAGRTGLGWFGLHGVAGVKVKIQVLFIILILNVGMNDFNGLLGGFISPCVLAMPHSSEGLAGFLAYLRWPR